MLKLHEETPYYLAETLETIVYVITLTLLNSPIYHKDIICAAVRATFHGRFHNYDSADMSEVLDCNDINMTTASLQKVFEQK